MAISRPEEEIRARCAVEAADADRDRMDLPAADDGHQLVADLLHTQATLDQRP